MAKINGATLIARSLKEQGIDHLFGVVGFPVGPIAEAAQKEGINYVGMSNEQSSVLCNSGIWLYDWATRACIVVTGPGVVHGLAGLANAQQELLANDQSAALLKPTAVEWVLSKRSVRCLSQVHFVNSPMPLIGVKRIPYYVEMATRHSIYGRPGACYIDMPDDIIQGECELDDIVKVERVPEPPKMITPAENIEAALNVLEGAERPLVLVGKGMAWAQAEDEVRLLLIRPQLPFVRSPMGKGVIPDDHPLAASAARTLALQQADVVFLWVHALTGSFILDYHRGFLQM